MVFVPFADVGQACIQFDVLGDPVSVCLHWEAPSTPTPAEYQQLADEIRQQWTLHLLPNQHQSFDLIEVRVYDLSSQNAPVYTSAVVPPASGGRITAPLPLNASMVLSFATNNRGKSYRGRMYFPGLVEADGDDRQWNQPALNAVAAGFATFLTNVENNSGFELVVASRQEDGIIRTQGVATRVETVTVKAKIGTRRKRLPGTF